MSTGETKLTPKNLLPKDEYYVEDISPISGLYFVIQIKNKFFKGKSEYQKIAVIDTFDFGHMLILDDAIQTTEKDEFMYHETLIHPTLVMTPNPKKVLVIGGGDGGSIEEILKCKTIESIVQVELDAKVVEVSKQYLQAVNKGAYDNPKVKLIIQDGRKYIFETKETFDAIILDLTDPIGPSARLYTTEFYQQVANRLTPGGVIALHGSAWIGYPIITNIIFNTVKTVFDHCRIVSVNIPSYGNDLAFIHASVTTPVESFDAKLFDSRLRERYNLDSLRWVDVDYLQNAGSFIPKPMKQALAEKPPRISTDSKPVSFEEFYPWVIED
jgi:spermidine synthase